MPSGLAEHNTGGKEMSAMENANNESKAQVKQTEQNKARKAGTDTNGDGNFDKKLDGPNYPAE
jgi:hypothetical protein